VTDSILDSVKKAIGFDTSYTAFDIDLIMHINSTLSTLNQLGVGPADGFMISDSVATWTNYVGVTPKLNSVKTYVYLKVRILFDPPATSFGIAAMEKCATELEWRLQVAVDPIVVYPDSYKEPVLQPFPELSQDTMLWNLTGLNDFPPEAPVGALGINLTTGDVWKNV